MPDAVLGMLIERGLAAWVPDGIGTVFEPTELGRLALRCDAMARGLVGA